MSSKITDKDGKEYKLVLGKFDKFFTEVGKNVIFERAGFNWRNQIEAICDHSAQSGRKLQFETRGDLRQNCCGDSDTALTVQSRIGEL